MSFAEIFTQRAKRETCFDIKEFSSPSNMFAKPIKIKRSRKNNNHRGLFLIMSH